MRENFVHRVFHVWGSISFWSGFTASERRGADHVEFDVGRGDGRVTLRLPLSDQTPVDRMVSALNAAVEVGDVCARADIRQALRIKELRL